MRSRRARLADISALAEAMPHVARWEERDESLPIYQVGGRSFLFFRTPRPDTVDPDTGQRYDDVIVLWVGSLADKAALVADETTPWFTTAHFDGHCSVLLRACRVGELTYQELREAVEEAWLSRASAARAKAWLASRVTT